MPCRRWFRFSLRTMLVVVLLAAIPMGWVAVQVKWIRDRHKALEWLRSQPPLFMSGWVVRTTSAPLSLRPFGEQGYYEILVHLDAERGPYTDAHLKALFPEAHYVGDLIIEKATPRRPWGPESVDELLKPHAKRP